MSGASFNIHATAITVEGRGLIFTGPSGAGKSMMAFQCLTIARRMRVEAALVADDQILVSRSDNRIIATCPPSIAGMMELRGSGIVKMAHVPSAAMDLAIQVASPTGAERLPPQGERFALGDAGDLPMIRIMANVADPLAVIGALMPSWQEGSTIW